MPTSEFMMREVTHTDREMRKVSVIRMRNSKGYASITLKVDEQSITFDTEKMGADYEQVALATARLLDRASNDSCQLPIKDKELHNRD